MTRELAIEFSRVMEAAVLAGDQWLGRGYYKRSNKIVELNKKMFV